MADIEVTPGRLGAALRSLEARLRQGVNDGLRLAAARGRTHLVRRTPVDTGQVKNAWKVTGGLGAWEVENDAPHAGIVERGARPHTVSQEGIAAIEQWVLRHFKAGIRSVARQRKKYGARATYGPKSKRRVRSLEQQYAHEIAVKIANKIRREGQKPTFFVRDSLPALREYVGAEVKRMLRRVAGSGR